MAFISADEARHNSSTHSTRAIEEELEDLMELIQAESLSGYTIVIWYGELSEAAVTKLQELGYKVTEGEYRGKETFTITW